LDDSTIEAFCKDSATAMQAHNYREEGKVLKGPNYTPPNVAAVLGEATGTDWAK